MDAGNLDMSYLDAPVDLQLCIKAHRGIITTPSSIQDHRSRHPVDNWDNTAALHHLYSLPHLGLIMATCKVTRGDTVPAPIVATIRHIHETIIATMDTQQSLSSLNGRRSDHTMGCQSQP